MTSKHMADREEKLATDAHEAWRRIYLTSTDQAINFAIAAMRAPALAAAGGIAGALGFFASNAGQWSSSELDHFQSTLVWLFLSLLLTVAAPSLAYLSQYCFAVSNGNHVFDFQHPYVHPKPSANRYLVVGKALHGMAILCVFVSLVFLILGAVSFMRIV